MNHAVLSGYDPMKYKILVSCVLIAIIAFQAFVVMEALPELRVLEINIPADESQSLAKRIEFQERVIAQNGQYIGDIVLLSDILAIPILAILLVLIIKDSPDKKPDHIDAPPKNF